VRIVDQNGKPLPDLYGEDLGLGVPLGTGNPTKPYGVSLTVERSIENNTIGKIRLQPAK
jgi:immune inhibitor A